MKYHFISAALLIAGIGLETAGIGNPDNALAATLFTAGVACELAFWIRLGLSKISGRQKTVSR
jgi:hypothetical protein